MKTVNYDLSIYPASCFNNAIQAYSRICRIEAIMSETNCTLCFSEFLYDEETTIKEFNNYLIDLMGAGNEL